MTRWPAWAGVAGGRVRPLIALIAFLAVAAGTMVASELPWLLPVGLRTRGPALEPAADLAG